MRRDYSEEELELLKDVIQDSQLFLSKFKKSVSDISEVVNDIGGNRWNELRDILKKFKWDDLEDVLEELMDIAATELPRG